MTQDDRSLELPRRTALAAILGSAATLALAGADSAGGGSAPPAKLAAKFKDRVWQREVGARIEGDVRPGAQVHGYGSGIVHAVREGDAVRPLFGFEVFSSIRIVRLPNQRFQRLGREVVMYRDLQTGALIDNWTNPYTEERVEVVDVTNDPSSYVFNEYGMQPSSEGHSDAVVEGARFANEWYMANENMVSCDRDLHVNVKSPMDPAAWPREAPGAMFRVSEMSRLLVRIDDLLNESLPHIPHVGIWVRVTPWLPWMLMDGAPGHLLHVGTISTRRDLTGFRESVRQRIQERYPRFARAPDAWGEKSYSTLQNYMRTRKPASKRGS